MRSFTGYYKGEVYAKPTSRKKYKNIGLQFLLKVCRVMFFQYSELICSLRNQMKAHFLSVVHANEKFISRGHLKQ